MNKKEEILSLLNEIREVNREVSAIVTELCDHTHSVKITVHDIRTDLHDIALRINAIEIKTDQPQTIPNLLPDAA